MSAVSTCSACGRAVEPVLVGRHEPDGRVTCVFCLRRLRKRLWARVKDGDENGNL